MTTLDNVHGTFIVKDRISALTHFIGFLAALAGMPLLLMKAAAHHADAMPALSIFMGCCTGQAPPIMLLISIPRPTLS